MKLSFDEAIERINDLRSVDWKHQLQAETTQNLAHDGFDGAWTADDWAETCAAAIDEGDAIIDPTLWIREA